MTDERVETLHKLLERAAFHGVVVGAAADALASLERELEAKDERIAELTRMWESKNLYPISELEQKVAHLHGQLSAAREVVEAARDLLRWCGNDDVDALEQVIARYDEVTNGKG